VSGVGSAAWAPGLLATWRRSALVVGGLRFAGKTTASFWLVVDDDGDASRVGEERSVQHIRSQGQIAELGAFIESLSRTEMTVRLVT
jgi:hypothetical protein